MQGLIGEPLMARPADLVLWRSGRVYYAGGRKVFSLSGGDYAHPPHLQVHDQELLSLLRGRRKGRRPEWLRRDSATTRELIADGNIVRLVRLEEEAVDFLHQVRESYPDLPLVVSWSGGKDSTVASMLAQRAFPTERIPHVFADTTIELPSTYEFLREFRRINPAIPLLVGLPARDFFELCREIGPPSRIQRWCCTTHKAAPLTDVLRAIARDRHILVVTGLRRFESASRKSYDRVARKHKIAIEVQLNPVADWSDSDVWLWHIVKAMPMNEAYAIGLDRVGCMHCPSAGDWTELVISARWRHQTDKWRQTLIELFAGWGVVDAAAYVDQGQWKGRSTGNVGSVHLGRALTYHIGITPCQDDPCAVTYELAPQFDLGMLFELLKPFGNVSRQVGPDIVGDYRVSGPNGSFALHALPHWGRIRVTFATAATRRQLEGAIRLQLRKLQACIGCSGCAALCPRGAIVGVGSAYHIVDERCSHCLACVRGLKAGCRAAHSLNSRGVIRLA